MIGFSICLPVYNGWPFIKECVESILQQTYPNLELHILDNCSTDGTSAWLKTIKDLRIHVWHSDVFLTIVENWDRIKGIKKLEFMTMIGHDDILDPNFLEVTKRLIDSNPDAGLYLTGGRFIDASGKIIRSCKPVPPRETAVDYLKSRLTFQRDVFGTGYVMRSCDYDRLGGIPNFEKLFFSDDALWLSLMKNTYTAVDPSEQFSIRLHSASESASTPSSWQSTLRGLQQFSCFLKKYDDNETKKLNVVGNLSDGFMLRYHLNAYILALVEASQMGHVAPESVVDQITLSLSKCSTKLNINQLSSKKIKIIKMLNASFLRELIPLFWKIYFWLKNKSQ